MKKVYSDLKKALGQDAFLDELMSSHTTFHIGGPADILIKPKDLNALKKAMKIIYASSVPYFIMGNGSDLLVSDTGFRGAVIKLAGNFDKVDFKENGVEAQAGVYLKRLITEAAAKGLSGLEYHIGIPAALGGALRMNAGGMGVSIAALVKTVTVLTKDLKTKVISRDKCFFGYRDAAINDEIIIGAELKLAEASPDEIIKKQENILKMKASTQPVGQPSAGCIFKNPPAPADPAGMLIEKANLKGESYGGAQVSSVHANYIVNTGGATASDVINLIGRVKGIVMEKFGIELELEVKKVGF